MKSKYIILLSILFLSNELLCQNGIILSWGYNKSNKLGYKTAIWKSPEQIGIDKWTFIKTNNFYSIGLKNNGTIFEWGGYDFDNYNIHTPTQIGVISGLVKINSESSNNHKLGLKSDGSVWCWGNNAFGQCGNGSTGYLNDPRQLDNNNYLDIAAGEHHSLAIRNDSTLWGWGYNAQGQLGIGNKTNQTTPQKIGSFNDWKLIAANWLISCGIRRDSTFYIWGLSHKDTPECIDKTKKCISAEVSSYGTVSLIASDGSLWT
jgi:alpha-tubulin suppressor-like RCC1 family protein